MSQTETHIGKLKLVPKLENEDLESQCKRLLNNKPLDKYCDTYEEMFKDEYYRKYVIYKDDIYKITEDKHLLGDDIYTANKNNDGTISFTTSFYNSGCGFDEALQECLDSMEE